MAIKEEKRKSWPIRLLLIYFPKEIDINLDDASGGRNVGPKHKKGGDGS